MFRNTNMELPSTKAIVATAASAAGTMMLLRSLAKDYLPKELQRYIRLKVKTFLKTFSSEVTLVIEEFDNLNQNHLFKAAELYIEPIIPPNTQRLKVSLTKKQSQPSISLDKNQEVVDTYKGVTIKWLFVSVQETGKRYVRDPNHYYNSVPVSEKRSFELSFHKKHKSFVLDDYLKHIVEKSKETKEKKKTLKLFTLSGDRMGGGRGNAWQGVNLDHPATFETVAMDVELKRMIKEDLERFQRRKEFYRKVGKAWKRGYLLYGPPGTGKSSLIAAMANHLKFDIYDLELTRLGGNSHLRQLLVSTASNSILVVEDIDCSIELQDRRAKARALMPPPTHPGFNQGYQPEVTLSGLLNFIDGLWSSLGDERIIIFTSNFKEKLDPALLRPGRMDVHIHMSYCTPGVFEILASNYHGIPGHPLFAKVEELIGTTDVTPAEVGEQLMKSEEPEIALTSLIKFIEEKKSKIEESKKTTSSSSSEEKKKTRSDGSQANKEQVEAVEKGNLQPLPQNNGGIQIAKTAEKI